jgi:hypothetical protein
MHDPGVLVVYEPRASARQALAAAAASAGAVTVVAIAPRDGRARSLRRAGLDVRVVA